MGNPEGTQEIFLEKPRKNSKRIHGGNPKEFPSKILKELLEELLKELQMKFWKTPEEILEKL